MARLLAYNSPAPGQVFPSVGMLLELHSRGHEVHLRTQESEVERLRALGLEAAPVDPRIPAIEIDDWRGRTQAAAMRLLLDGLENRAPLEIAELTAAIDELRPDALIVDNTCQGAGYAALASGLPWALYCPYPPPFRSVDAPPHGLGLIPARGPIGRARDRAVRRLTDLVLLAPQLPPLNDLRAGLGLPPLRRFDDQYLEADRFIAFTAEPYEYPRSDWPAGVRLVGPGAWEPPADPPDWLAEETRPIVLVTTSTALQDDSKLIATALEALAGEDLAVIATTGAHDPGGFAAPPNARVEQFLSHGPIIARAACVVAHGGQGITQKSLAAGVPVCVVPFSRDQFDVARRVQLSDAGIRLHHKRLTPARLRAAVHRAIVKRPGAERVAQAFAAAGGSSAAADAVEELLPAPGAGARSDTLRIGTTPSTRTLMR